MPRPKISRLLADRALVVVGGAGGVGKTTISAALAVRAALEGQRVAVLTIDPARRLGAALGFRKLGNSLRYTPAKKLDPWRKEKGGCLAASMLDVKGTFDQLVIRYSPSTQIKDRILSNPFYSELSVALSGTHEYMALERVYELLALEEFDLVILDTPPGSAFSDFLEAPHIITSFFDRDIVRWFLATKKTGLRGIASSTLGKGVEWALQLLDRLAGGKVLEEVSQFLRDFQTLFDGFRERAQSVDAVLHDRKTAFILASTSDHLPWVGAQEMADTLKKADLTLSAIIFNRMLPSPLPAPDIDVSPTLRKTAETMLKRQDQIRSEFRSRFDRLPHFDIPLQEKDPATLQDLAKLPIL